MIKTPSTFRKKLIVILPSQKPRNPTVAAMRKRSAGAHLAQSAPVQDRSLAQLIKTEKY